MTHAYQDMNWLGFQECMHAQQHAWLSQNTQWFAAQTLSNPGKQLRAQLVFLTAQLLGGVQQAHVVLACAIECLHTASLLHDDVLDNGYVRRGQRCAHQLWGNKVAILSGDWWLAKSLALVLKIQSKDVQIQIQGAMEKLVLGQIMDCQMPMGASTKDYLQMIGDKTACLFSVAASSAAQLSNACQDQVEALKSYGWAMGMAYQFNDDAAEYAMPPQKWDVGHDFVQKKVTYPWMAARDCLDTDSWEHVMGIQNKIHAWALQDSIQSEEPTFGLMDPSLYGLVQEVHALLHNSVHETYALADQYTMLAWDRLKKIWPESALVPWVSWGQQSGRSSGRT